MKKKSLQKLLALGLVGAMTVSMLAGCGSSNDAGSTGSSDSASAESGEVPTLVWWLIGGTVPDDFEQNVETISDYTEEKIGVRLDIKIAGYGDYDSKMNTIVNSGEYFDIMFGRSKKASC